MPRKYLSSLTVGESIMRTSLSFKTLGVFECTRDLRINTLLYSDADGHHHLPGSDDIVATDLGVAVT